MCIRDRAGRVAGPGPNRREAFPPLTGSSAKVPAATSVASGAAVSPAVVASAPPAAASTPAPAGAPAPSYAAMAAKSVPPPARSGKSKRSRRRRNSAGRPTLSQVPPVPSPRVRSAPSHRPKPPSEQSNVTSSRHTSDI